MESAFVPLSLVAGGLLAVQAGANTQLSKATGSPFAATTLQLGVGAALLFVIAAATGSLGALAALPHATWWHALGGIASAFYVVATILLFPRLGAVVAVGLSIAGQMLASLTLDAFGLLGVPQAAIDPTSAMGTLMVLAGAAAIVVGQGSSRTAMPLSTRLPWIVFALAAGAVLPIQGAVNGLLRTELQAPFAVATTSFVVATLAMGSVLALANAYGVAPKPSLGRLPLMPWWGWLGGVAGAVYVTTVFTAIPAIGAAAAVGFTVAGQQFASVLVDRYGLLRLPQRPVSAIRLGGVVVLLAGVTAIKFL
jgi:bacterial/archaeal transporter family-2 protein